MAKQNKNLEWSSEGGALERWGILELGPSEAGPLGGGYMRRMQKSEGSGLGKNL